MTFVYNIFVALHFIGLALLFGGFIVQVRSAEKGVSRWMLDGALTQLITGVVMVGLLSSKVLGDEEGPLNYGKITTKLIVVLVVTVLAIIGRRRSGNQVALWGAIGALTLANILIAVFWQ